MRLFICGNGLDKHIGFESDYNRYREYLITHKLSNGDVVDRLDHSKYFGITRVNKQEIKWSNL